MRDHIPKQTRLSQRPLSQRSAVRGVKLEDPLESIASAPVATCAPEDSLATAAQSMWEHDCGALPVVDARGKVVGMITDRDALMAAHTRGAFLADLTVESAMSTTVHSCRPEESVGRALQLMRRAKVRRLPILTRAGHLVGILSFADLARRLERCPPASTELTRALADVCERAGAARNWRGADSNWGLERW